MFFITEFFQTLARVNPFLDGIIIFFAVVFPYLLVFFTVIFLIKIHILKYKNGRATLRLEHIRLWLSDMSSIIFSVLSALLISEVLKQAINSPRPYIFDGYTNYLFNLGYHASFPSTHTAVFSALAFTMMLSHRKVGGALLVGALLVGLARISAGVHFASDIFGGLLIGLLVSFIIAIVRDGLGHDISS